MRLSEELYEALKRKEEALLLRYPGISLSLNTEELASQDLSSLSIYVRFNASMPIANDLILEGSLSDAVIADMINNIMAHLKNMIKLWMEGAEE